MILAAVTLQKRYYCITPYFRRVDELGQRTKIDEIDIVILKAMLKNARISYADIAKKCGISSNSIKLRFNRLKEEGIITGLITQVNPKKLGYNYIAFLPIQASANKIRKVYDFLKNTPNMINIFQEIGSYNILVTVALKKIENIDKVIAYIKGNPDVLTVNALIAWDLVMVDHAENLDIETFKG